MTSSPHACLLFLCIYTIIDSSVFLALSLVPPYSLLFTAIMAANRYGKFQGQPPTTPVLTPTPLPSSSANNTRILRSQTAAAKPQPAPATGKRQRGEESAQLPKPKRLPKTQKNYVFNEPPVQYAAPANITVVNSQNPYHLNGHYVPHEHFAAYGYPTPNHHHVPIPRQDQSFVLPVSNAYGHPTEFVGTGPPPPHHAPPPPVRQQHVPHPSDVEFVPDSEEEEEGSVSEIRDPPASNTPQFQEPVPVLQDHWRRNGVPKAPTTHASAGPHSHRPLPSSMPAPRIAGVPYPTPVPTPSSDRPVEMPRPRQQQGPVPAPTPQPPTQEEPEWVAIKNNSVNGDPKLLGSWPPRWQKLLGYARGFVLNDILLNNGFPSGFKMVTEAGEALPQAWLLYEQKHPAEPLYKHHFNHHRGSLRKIVVDGAVNHRGKLRDAILNIIKAESSFAHPDSSPLTITELAEGLLKDHRLFDSYYVNNARTPESMYSSPILKKALRHVYDSKLWRDALCLTFHRVHQGFEYNEFDLNSDVEGSWSSYPPPSLVAFVGTLITNALHCFVSGIDGPRVPLSENDYRSTYMLLSAHVMADWYGPHGNTVRENLHKAIQGILISRPPAHD